MATKKQKRAEALAKRERWLEEVRLSGLKAQREDQERRKNKALGEKTKKTMEDAEDE